MSSTRVGRNDPCPCGSRKKFKHCCYRLGNGNGVPQPMPVYGDGAAVRRVPSPSADGQNHRTAPPSLGVRVEYTIQDTLGKAEVTYRYPLDWFVILANGHITRVGLLTPGMQFLLEAGGIATVTKVDRPELREPPPPDVDANGNSLKRVVGTFKYTGWVPLLEVTYGGAVHKITPGHGYWSENRRGWYPIGTFQPGEWLRTEENEVVPVEGVVGPRWEQTSVYNVEVEDFHTYFAGKGDKFAWSHNGGADGCGVPKAAKMTEDDIIKGIKAPGKFDATVGAEADAVRAVRTALPHATELPPAVAGQSYPSPPKGVKAWFQVQPAEPGVGNDLPHVKYADWTGGKKGRGGTWGHIFFPPSPGS